VAQLDFDLTVALRTFALGVGLSVAGGETVALAGPSGSGKTTVLRAIAGLLRPDDGRVALDGRPWFDAAGGVDLPPERRAVGFVFQDYALFPHLTVERNVAFGAGDGGRTGELLERLRISHLAGERPGTLSGGERQRVALARALAREPAVLLLDEPLAALDAHTRAVVRDELADLLAQLALPTLLVTHDHRDAVALADRVGVLVDGRLRQVGAPRALLEAPADPFVARFTGANVIEGLGPGGAAIAAAPWAVRVLTEPLPSDGGDADGAWTVPGIVEGIDVDGPRARVRVGAIVAEVPAADAARLTRGQPAWAVIARADASILRPA
jgi:molybdate transport system ATP-binding protein